MTPKDLELEGITISNYPLDRTKIKGVSTGNSIRLFYIKFDLGDSNQCWCFSSESERNDYLATFK